MKVLLDSSAIIEYIKGNENVLKAMEEAQDSYTSALCAFETLAVADKDEDVESFISELSPLPFTLKDSKTAANIYSSLAKVGKMVNVMDVLIYSQAAERGLGIITKDNDYSIMNNVTKYGLKIFAI